MSEHFRHRSHRGVLILVLVMALAALGLGLGLWSASSSGSRVIAAATTTTTTVHSTTTVYKPRLSVAAPVSVQLPGGSMALNAGIVSFIHVVQPGENLSFIAHWYLEMGGEPALYAFNQATIGPNPNLIYAGDRLTVTMRAADVPKISPAYPPLQKLEATVRP